MEDKQKSLNTNPLINNSSDTKYATRHPFHKKIVRWLWRSFFIGTIVFFLFILSVMFTLPSFEQLENPATRVASEVISSDGKVLGKYFKENRTPVKYSDLSPHLVKALIATEDKRFYSHSGIDAEALLRVLKGLITFNSDAGGGSTVSQQLAKLLFDRPNLKNRFFPVKIFLMTRTKMKEWLTAVKLERSYTKEEIIAMYFNEFNFINGAYGVKSASETYFGKQPKDLNIEESATLVGMLKNPAYFNPKRFPDRTKDRRNTVLRLMKDNGKISSAEFNKAKATSLDISKFKREDHNEGLATYFREVLREDLSKILAKEQYLKPDGKKYDIYNDGLKIYVTLDSRMQAHAEKAATDHLKGHQKNLVNYWKQLKKDPWEYETRTSEKEDKAESLEQRQNALRRAVEASERYQGLKRQYMPKAEELELRDVDIRRMVQIEKEGDKQIQAWIKTKYITKEAGEKYRSLMKSGDWTEIKRQKKDLDIAVKRNFYDKKVKMKVFDYNAKFEKDTLMSPIDSIKYHRFFLQTGMMAVDPKTGHVKAWVGGINHNWFKYDHVNKSATRQVGSTIKPFLYALTIDLRGYSPCQKFIDEPTTIRKGEGRFNLLRDWTPKNSSGGYSGAQMTMIQALQRSINSISARMMKELGNTEVFRSYLYNVGIDTSYSAKVGGSRIPAQPSICLGTPDLSVFEMTGAYTAFANEGVYTEPTYIARIEDRNGNLIYTATPKRKQVLNEHAAYAMVFLLKSVVAGSGGFNGIRSEIGGKTGTTQYQSDGWFIGISPNLVVGTWVGCDDRFVRFEGNLAMGQGAVMARPIFQNFFRSVEADKSLAFNSSASFVKPEEIEIETDCAKYTGGEDNTGGTDITEDTDSGNDEGKKNNNKWGDEFDDDEKFNVDE